MSATSPKSSRLKSILAGVVILLVGAVAGYLLTSATTPPPREPALLWDDYIIAVAALYQRDGDLDAARGRLAKLSTDDPGASVAALAAIYVPDARYGETQATALRDLAQALTGRAIPAPLATAGPRNFDSPAEPFPARDQIRNPLLWAVLLAGSVLWLAVTRGRGAAGSRGVAVAMPVVVSGPLAVRPSAVPARPARPAVGAGSSLKNRLSRAIHQPSRDNVEPTMASVSVTFSYDGLHESSEEMKPIADPLTGKVVAGCGLTNGPYAGGEKGGYVGFLIWMHELASHELPQTLGLITDGAGEACKTAIAEWAEYARVDELVAARPGVVRTFETRRLRAAVSVSDLSQTKLRKSKHKVFRRLTVRLDVGFKQDSSRVSRATTLTPPARS